MAFWWFEASREGLKYRCPQVARGLACTGREQCPSAQGKYGKLVRIAMAEDRRLFVPLPRDTPAWDQAYAKRTAVARVNSRLDRVLGFEQHTIRGQAKMETRVGLSLRTLIDGDGDIATGYGVAGIPAFFVIGRDGKVAWSQAGFDPSRTPEALDAAVEQSLRAG